MIVPKIHHEEAIHIFGLKREVNFIRYDVEKLWQSFIPQKDKLPSNESDYYYSISEYPNDFFYSFSPERNFWKWAGMRVDENATLPNGFEAIIIPAGLYAVFCSTGEISQQEFFGYIYGAWLSSSPYQLRAAPHFELLHKSYQKDSKFNTEDVFIPIEVKVAPSMV